MSNSMMKAVVFKGLGKIVVEHRPIPTIKEPADIIVNVDKNKLGTISHPVVAHRPEIDLSSPVWLYSSPEIYI